MAAVTFALDRGELISVLVEGPIFGLAVAIGGRTISLLSSRTRVTNIFYIAIWTFLILAAVHTSVDWYRMVKAFLYIQDYEERIRFLGHRTDWTWEVNIYAVILEVVIADAILAYRCFLVWNRNWWVCVVPFMLVLTAVGSFIAGIARVSQAANSGLFQGEIRTSILLIWISTLATNVLATGLILGRLVWSMRVQGKLGGFTTWSVKPIMITLLESGAIYCTIVITAFSLFVSNSNAQTIMVKILSSIVPILFSFILLRLDRDHKERTAATALSTLQFRTHRTQTEQQSSSHWVEMPPLNQITAATSESKYSATGNNSSNIEMAP